MDVDQALISSSCDYDKSIPLIWLQTLMYFCERGKK